MSDINMLKELLTIIEETNNKISNINNDMINNFFIIIFLHLSFYHLY